MNASEHGFRFIEERKTKPKLNLQHSWTHADVEWEYTQIHHIFQPAFLFLFFKLIFIYCISSVTTWCSFCWSQELPQALQRAGQPCSQAILTKQPGARPFTLAFAARWPTQPLPWKADSWRPLCNQRTFLKAPRVLCIFSVSGYKLLKTSVAFSLPAVLMIPDEEVETPPASAVSKSLCGPSHTLFFTPCHPGGHYRYQRHPKSIPSSLCSTRPGFVSAWWLL